MVLVIPAEFRMWEKIQIMIFNFHSAESQECFFCRKGWMSFTLWWIVAGFLVSCSNQPVSKPAPAPAPAPAPKPVAVPAPAPAPVIVLTHENLIQGFTWPPPKASAEEAIPDKWFRDSSDTRLHAVADKIEKSLRLAHYRQWSYYSVPNGFALATHLEQIKSNGSPLKGDDRWKMGIPQMRNLSLIQFLKALTKAPPGHYRAIVFIVTDAPWRQTEEAPKSSDIEKWVFGGANQLPSSIGEIRYAEDYQTKALIYQFSKNASGSVIHVLPSPASGKIHLERSGIWEPLSIL